MPGHQTRAMLPALMTTAEAEVVEMPGAVRLEVAVSMLTTPAMLATAAAAVVGVAVMLETPQRPRIRGRSLSQHPAELGVQAPACFMSSFLAG